MILLRSAPDTIVLECQRCDWTKRLAPPVPFGHVSSLVSEHVLARHIDERWS
jgi:hypothetical protein